MLLTHVIFGLSQLLHQFRNEGIEHQDDGILEKRTERQKVSIGGLGSVYQDHGIGSVGKFTELGCGHAHDVRSNTPCDVGGMNRGHGLPGIGDEDREVLGSDDGSYPRRSGHQDPAGPI